MKFDYQAADVAGKMKRGSIEAASEAQAVRVLAEKGLTATAISAESAPPVFSESRAVKGRVARADVTLATRELAHLVEAGVTLPDAFSSVASQTPKPVLAHALADVAARVRRGQSLADAMEAYPKLFSPLTRALVAAGGESGELDVVLTRLADYLDARDALTQKLTTALIYPALVALVSFMVVLAMVTYVMPQVVSVFAQGKQALPWITQALIGVSNFVKSHWLPLLAICAAGIVSTIAFARSTHTRDRWDRLIVHLPIIGRFAREVDMTRFLQTLAMLSAAGVPLLSAFAASRKVVQRAPLREAVQRAETAIAQGSPITDALRATGQFPPMVMQLAANGEATGKLPAMLARAAIVSQQSVERRAAWLTALIEPALIVVMGAVVLVLVLAVMLPIVSINTIIR